MEQKEEDGTSEIISNPPTLNSNSKEDEEPNLTAAAFQDKASFREHASSFLKVLEESSRFRNKLPEPKGNRPGKLGDGLSPRPLPNKMDHEEDPAADGGDHGGGGTGGGDKLVGLNSPTMHKRTRSGPGLKQLDTKKTTLVAISDLPGKEKSAPQSPRTPVKHSVSLPPLTDLDPASRASRLKGVATYSRHGKDISAHLKLNEIGDNQSMSAPNSPRTMRGYNSPMSSRKTKDNISLDEATGGLCGPLISARGTPRN